MIKLFFKLYEFLIELVDKTPITFDYSYKFLEDLNKHKHDIIKEYQNVRPTLFNNISPETAPDKFFKNANWNVFILLTYGNFINENCYKCPTTFSIIKKHKIIKTAMFSILPPNSSMNEHRGPLKGVLRCLYKLQFDGAPNTACLQIKDKIFDWYNRDYIIFDDTLMHNAWNYSANPRAVLFLDLERPLVFPINILNKLILFLVNKNKRIKQIYEFYKQQNNLKD
jgi:beta-hydroxylase